MWHLAMELVAAVKELPLFQMNVPNNEKGQLSCSTAKLRYISKYQME